LLVRREWRHDRTDTTGGVRHQRQFMAGHFPMTPRAEPETVLHGVDVFRRSSTQERPWDEFVHLGSVCPAADAAGRIALHNLETDRPNQVGAVHALRGPFLLQGRTFKEHEPIRHGYSCPGLS
jgi:hypothetical protein